MHTDTTGAVAETPEKRTARLDKLRKNYRRWYDKTENRRHKAEYDAARWRALSKEKQQAKNKKYRIQKLPIDVNKTAIG